MFQSYINDLLMLYILMFDIGSMLELNHNYNGVLTVCYCYISIVIEIRIPFCYGELVVWCLNNGTVMEMGLIMRMLMDSD